MAIVSNGYENTVWTKVISEMWEHDITLARVLLGEKHERSDDQPTVLLNSFFHII